MEEVTGSTPISSSIEPTDWGAQIKRNSDSIDRSSDEGDRRRLWAKFRARLRHGANFSCDLQFPMHRRSVFLRTGNAVGPRGQVFQTLHHCLTGAEVAGASPASPPFTTPVCVSICVPKLSLQKLQVGASPFGKKR
jgi:hypothetical protein